MTWFSGWTVPPPPNRPPPAGVDLEEMIEEPESSRLSNSKAVSPKPRQSHSSKEYIDRDIIERILKDDVGQELKWLEELLQDGVRVLNNTGRFIKSEPFLAHIRKQKKLIQ